MVKHSYSPSLREKLLKGKLHHSPVGTARIFVVVSLEVKHNVPR